MEKVTTFQRMYFVLGGLLFENECCEAFFQREDYPRNLLSENKVIIDIVSFIRKTYHDNHILMTDSIFKDMICDKVGISTKNFDKSSKPDVYLTIWEKSEESYYESKDKPDYIQIWKTELKALVSSYVRDKVKATIKLQYQLLGKGCFGDSCEEECPYKKTCGECKKSGLSSFDFITSYCDTKVQRLQSLNQHTRRTVSLEYGANLESRLEVYKDEFKYLKDNKKTSLGVPWSIPSLNDITGGMNKGRVTAFCARTAGGKTAMAIQETAHAWQHHGVNILYLNLEMPMVEFTARLDSTLTQMSFASILGRNWKTQTEIDKFIDKRRSVDVDRKLKSEYVIKDIPRMNVTQLETFIRRYYNMWGENFICVLDNINIVEMPVGLPRHEACSLVMAKFHELVKELNITHGIILAQLNRDSENTQKSGIVTAKDVRDSDKLLDHVDYAFALISLGKRIKKLITMKARTALGFAIKLANNLWFMRMDEQSNKTNMYDEDEKDFCLDDEEELGFG